MIITTNINIGFGQSSSASTNYNSNNYLGWGNTSANDLPFRIGTGSPPTLLMLLKSGGDLDLTTPTKSYMINNNRFLWHNGNTTNIFCGVSAGNNGTMGDNNTFIGVNAGVSNAGSGSTNGDLNTFIGSIAGTNNTIGRGNTFIGRRCGASNTEGNWNTFTGTLAGYHNNTGNYNAFYGKEAGYENTTGLGNTFLGNHAGQANTTSNYSVMVGANSGYAADAYGNTFVGAGAGPYNTSGEKNIIVGLDAGVSNATGNRNIFIGVLSQPFGSADDLEYSIAIGDQSEVGGNYAVAIGANANAPVSKSMILGDDDINVGIGLSGDATGPLAKFHVFRENTNSVLNPTAVYVDNVDEDPEGTSSTGIHNITHGDNGLNTGVFSEAYDADNNTAGAFHATHSASEYNIGGYGTAEYGGVNIGIYGNAPTWTEPCYFNVGVYGAAPSNHTSDFPGAGYGTYAGYFDGDVAVMGAFYNVSDSTIKTNLQPIQNVNLIFDQINAYSYYFDTLQLKGIANVPRKKQFGLLSQQVEAVAPNLVLNTAFAPVRDSVGNIVIAAKPVKILNYLGIIPLLVEGHKEQQSIIETLNTRITDLEAIVAACCGANRSTNSEPGNTGENNSQRVKLMNSENAILYTNQPNPYTSSTTIRYFIPENTSDVKITFQDATGKTLKEVPVNETGQGSIIVDGSELINGIYTYSLVIGNKIVDTKKMVKQ